LDNNTIRQNDKDRYDIVMCKVLASLDLQMDVSLWKLAWKCRLGFWKTSTIF